MTYKNIPSDLDIIYWMAVFKKFPVTNCKNLPHPYRQQFKEWTVKYMDYVLSDDANERICKLKEDINKPKE